MRLNSKEIIFKNHSMHTISYNDKQLSHAGNLSEALRHMTSGEKNMGDNLQR